MALSDILSSFGAYWGVVQTAVKNFASTASIWSQINAFENAQGISRPQGLFQWVTQARSLAASQRNAGTTLQRALDEDAIDSSMIAQDYNARPYSDQNLSPIYRVRYQTTTVSSEGEGTQWLTYVHYGTLPATVGELRDIINSAAVESSSKYDFLVTGVTGDMGITAG